MLKAVLGGGGKGMRIVWNDDEFDEALEGCKREALASFKDERVLLERYIQNPRHIEFQVFADKQGNAVHLFERDCSVQRRHQKVFEEAPAPGMDPQMRAKMGKSATDAAQAVGYVGAGTVEFIVDADTNEYFFMEMNTRLQVEHCVTEMVVHRDLVQWQMHVAAGHRLPAEQAGVEATGHALELRVYAENPRNNFFPTTGRLAYMKAPALAHDVRVETGVRSGDEVSVHYDPMISKLVVSGPNRELCLRRMIKAIDDYKIAGLPTNLEFAKAVLNHEEFKKGMVTTKFIPLYKDELLPPVEAPPADVIVATTLNLLLQEKEIYDAKGVVDQSGPWNRSSTFRLNNKKPVRRVAFETEIDGKKQTIQVDVSIPHGKVGNTKTQQYEMTIVGDATGTVYKTDGVLDTDGNLRSFVGENSVQATVFTDAKTNEVHFFNPQGAHYKLKLPTKSFGSSISAGSGAVSPMAGKIVKVHVKAGDAVKAGQPLIVMEAMKMEHILRAATDGVVKSVPYGTGDFCEGGKPVVLFVEQDKE
jgi:3-methylcrotonyl-CoA carboxylase alpha subunit